jgi:hypothetical protein
MSHNQKELPQQELLNELTSADGNQNSLNYGEELIERERIENTPLDIIGNTKLGYFLALGRFRVSEKFEHKNIAEDHLESHKWEIIMNCISAALQGYEEEQRNRL